MRLRIEYKRIKSKHRSFRVRTIHPNWPNSFRNYLAIDNPIFAFKPQCILVYILALILGVKIDWNPLALIGVLTAILLGAAAFSAFSLIIALLVKTRERFMGIGQVLTMPFFFASSAIYPISIMPGWLKVIAHGNPLTYEVDALRALMLSGGTSSFGLALDFGVLALVTTVMVIIAGRLYPNAVT